MPWYCHAKFGCNWTTNKGEMEWGAHCSLYSNTSWLTVSKAFHKSRKTAMFYSPLSMFKNQLFVVSNRNVLVECFLPKSRLKAVKIRLNTGKELLVN